MYQDYCGETGNNIVITMLQYSNYYITIITISFYYIKMIPWLFCSILKCVCYKLQNVTNTMCQIDDVAMQQRHWNATTHQNKYGGSKKIKQLLRLMSVNTNTIVILNKSKNIQNQKYFIYPEENSVCNRSPVDLAEIKSMYTKQIVGACNKIK